MPPSDLKCEHLGNTTALHIVGTALQYVYEFTLELVDRPSTESRFPVVQPTQAVQNRRENGSR